MREWTDGDVERHVVERLSRLGLTGPTFAPAPAIADLRERLALDGELDELIGLPDSGTEADRSAPVEDDPPFDPRRP